ncbi:MAG: arylsulfatase, partial [Deltaproteobacteria bacterium]|nr:arylsulfatase [Deltaproteobacteria bacterium]
MANIAHFNISGKDPLAPGKHTIVFDFSYDGGGYGKGGTGTLNVDGQPVAEGRIGATMPMRFSLDETFDIGEDTGTPVNEDYDVPFKFTGQIDKIVVHLGELKLSIADQQKLQGMDRNARLAVE